MIYLLVNEKKLVPLNKTITVREEDDGSGAFYYDNEKIKTFEDVKSAKEKLIWLSNMLKYTEEGNYIRL